MTRPNEIEGPAAPDRPARPRRRAKVLLADDHPVNRKVVELILTGANVELSCVADGAEAVAAFRAERFDAVLMDVKMPVMDGTAAIAAIRALERAQGRPRTPILLLTAEDGASNGAQAKAAGADAQVAKPVSPAALLAWLDRALGSTTPKD